MPPLKIVLLSSAFNGLTQRAWLDLREAGYRPSVVLFTDAASACRQIEESGADLVICPFLKDRVPKQLWRNPRRPVVIIHPGIVGDRGASALDWAITRQPDRWGVTALQAVEEMDAGPIWATCEFDLPKGLRKSELYNGPVSDAAIHCIREVVEKHRDGFVPVPLDYGRPDVVGRLQPNMTQDDRSFSWHDSSVFIQRCIDAADGQPGVLASLAGEQFYLYDAHPDVRHGLPGELCWPCVTMRCWWQQGMQACGSAPCAANRNPANRLSNARRAMSCRTASKASRCSTVPWPGSRSATSLINLFATANAAMSGS